MATQKMPDHLTKVSYILEKRAKTKLEKAAEKSGKSMSALITEALTKIGVLPSKAA